MKRLLILTAIAMTFTSSSGCRSWNWFRRGDQCDTCVSSASGCGSTQGPIMSGVAPGTVIYGAPTVSGAAPSHSVLPGPGPGEQVYPRG